MKVSELLWDGGRGDKELTVLESGMVITLVHVFWGGGLEKEGSPWVLPSPFLFLSLLKYPVFLQQCGCSSKIKTAGNVNGQVLLATGASPRRACGAEQNCPVAEMRVIRVRSKSPLPAGLLQFLGGTDS